MTVSTDVTISENDIPFYAALIDISYRRASTDYRLTIDTLNDIRGNTVSNPFLNIDGLETIGGLTNALNNFLGSSASGSGLDNFTHLATDNGGLGFQVSEGDDGIFHIYNAMGFGAFIVQTGSEFIITFRGTDVSGMNDAGNPQLIRASLQALLGDSFDDVGQIGSHEDHVDEGDFFTNIKLGRGTTVVTQYDYAIALTHFVIEQLADGHVNNVTVTGHSLGAGLATLVGAELGTNLVTFAAAPFENQLEFIAAKHAARDIMEQYPELFSRAFSGMTDLEIGDLFLHPNIIRPGNDNPLTLGTLFLPEQTYIGEILITDLGVIDDFNDALNTYLNEYHARIDGGFFSAVQGEFTSTLGGIEFQTNLRLGSHIPTDEFLSTAIDYDNVFEIGRNLTEFASENVGLTTSVDHPTSVGALTTEGLDARTKYLKALESPGEGSLRHSGSLHALMWATKLDDTVKSFADILISDNFLRFSLFHTPGLAGTVLEDRLGEGDDPSTILGRNLSVEPFYRLLSISTMTDNGFYSYFSDFIGVAGEYNSILAPVRLSGNADPTQKNLHSAVIELSLQIIRDALSGATDFAGFEANLNDNGVDNFQFAGDFDADGYITLNIDAIKAISRDPEPDDNGVRSDDVDTRLQEAIYDSPPPNALLLRPDYYSAYGITDLGQAIFDRLIVEGLSEIEAIEYTKIEIQQNGFINYVPFATDFGAQVDTLIVQTFTGSLGSYSRAAEVNIDLSAQTQGGAAIFLGGGSSWSNRFDLVYGTQADDFIFGNDNHNIIAGNGGDDVIIAGGGNDLIIAGQGTDIIYGGEDYPITTNSETGESTSSDIDTLKVLEEVVTADDFNHEFIHDADGNIIAEAGIITATVNGEAVRIEYHEIERIEINRVEMDRDIFIEITLPEQGCTEQEIADETCDPNTDDTQDRDPSEGGGNELIFPIRDLLEAIFGIFDPSDEESTDGVLNGSTGEIIRDGDNLIIIETDRFGRETEYVVEGFYTNGEGTEATSVFYHLNAEELQNIDWEATLEASEDAGFGNVVIYNDPTTGNIVELAGILNEDGQFERLSETRYIAADQMSYFRSEATLEAVEGAVEFNLTEYVRNGEDVDVEELGSIFGSQLGSIFGGLDVFDLIEVETTASEIIANVSDFQHIADAAVSLLSILFPPNYEDNQGDQGNLSGPSLLGAAFDATVSGLGAQPVILSGAPTASETVPGILADSLVGSLGLDGELGEAVSDIVEEFITDNLASLAQGESVDFSALSLNNLRSLIGPVLGDILADELADLIGVDGLVGDALADITQELISNNINSLINGGSVDFSALNPLNILNSFGADTLGSLLASELAGAIGLDGAAGDVFVDISGQFISDNLTSIIAGNGFDFTALTSINPAAIIASVLGDHIVNALTDIDSTENAIAMAVGGAIGGYIGATLGNILFPGFGAILGNVLGQIVGDLLFDAVSALIGPLDSPWYYNSVRLEDGQLVRPDSYSNPQQDNVFTNGAEHPELGNAVNDLTDAVILTINNIFDSVGGRIDESNFNSSTHFQLGYHHEHNDFGHGDFQFRANTFDDGTLHGDGLTIQELFPDAYGPDSNPYRNNNEHTYYIHGDDLRSLAQAAIEYEFRYVDFYDGDLVKVQAINAWQEIYSETASGDRLELLNNNLRIAEDYRTYLNHTAEINTLIAANPNSAFAQAWVITLLEAETLGLNDDITWHGSHQIVTRRFTEDEATRLTDQDTPTFITVVETIHFDDFVLGADGNDAFYGNGGNDFLRGYGGNDILDGGNGDDILFGGYGGDTLSGGQGNDIAIYEGDVSDYRIEHVAYNTYRIYDLNNESVFDELEGIETLRFYADYDSLTGEAADFADYSISAITNHIIMGSDGNETIFGGDNNDVIDGGAGDDQIYGGHGNDLIIGGEGTDVLYGSDGDDILDAGAGTGGWQYLLGQSGDDTYLYGTESGNVFIGWNAESATSGTADRLVLTDLALSDVTFSLADYTQGGTNNNANGVALQIDWSRDGESGRIRIANMGEHIESFEFADGSVLGRVTADQFAGGRDSLVGTSGNDLIIGTSNDDFIYGSDGDDILDAGAGIGGWQYLFGQGGDDTYLYGTESGNVLIGWSAESATSGTADRLVLTDLALSDVTFSTYDYTQGGTVSSNHGVALTINWSRDGESGEIRIANMGEHIESFEFADGSVLGRVTADQFAGGRDSLVGTSGNDLIIGTSNDDFIYGSDGDDILDAGAGIGGWQYLLGQGGDDTYLYGTESGNVLIGWNAESATSGTADRLVLTDLALSDVTFSLADYTQGGTNNNANGVALTINWSRDGESGEIRIANMGEHIESFEFADGSVLGRVTADQFAGGRDSLVGTSGNDLIIGTSNDDFIYGSDGDDILDAGAGTGGWQYLFGQGGDDTYLYGTESGNVFIGWNAESATSGTADRLVLTDLALSDVTFSTYDYTQGGTVSSNHGVALTINWSRDGESGEIRIANMGEHIESFEFADGSVLGRVTADQFAGGRDSLVGTSGNDLIIGTSNDDFIYGSDGDDILDAGAGIGGWQYLFGQGGDDTYLYGTESGNVFIGWNAESATSGTADRLVLTDLALSDVTFSTYDYTQGGTVSSNHGVALTINWSRDGESGEIRIANMGEHIESFEFADGSVLGRVTADQFAGGRDSLVGTSGNDLIIGTSNDDFIYGSDGDDILDAGAGIGGWQYLFGQGGDDTYLYGTESGNVLIGWSAESATSGTADRLVLTDLALSDVTFSTYDYTQGGTVSSNHGVALTINWSRDGESGEIRIANMGEHIESFEFADGSIVTDFDTSGSVLNSEAIGDVEKMISNLEDDKSDIENGVDALLTIAIDDYDFLPNWEDGLDSFGLSLPIVSNLNATLSQSTALTEPMIVIEGDSGIASIKDMYIDGFLEDVFF